MEHNKEQTDMVVSQAVRLIDFIDYQAGSVVSRTIVNKKTGSVTLFAFDKGQGLSEHTSPFDAMVYIIDGEAEITISDKPFRLEAVEPDFIRNAISIRG